MIELLKFLTSALVPRSFSLKDIDLMSNDDNGILTNHELYQQEETAKLNFGTLGMERKYIPFNLIIMQSIKLNGTKTEIGY